MRKFCSLKKTVLLASLFIAFLLSNSILTASAEVSNIAIKKAYTSSSPASTSYPDTNSQELTDGAYGTSNFKDLQWQGRQNVSNYTQTIDFGDNSYITNVSCRFLQQSGCAIFWPTTVTFSCSNDGVTYTQMGNAEKNNISTEIAKYTYSLPNAIRTRYVKMEVITAGEWTFEDEFEATGISDSPLNIAQNKRYSTSSPAEAKYPDNKLKELTNGKFASGTYTDSEWQGQLGNYSVTLDLGTNMRITSLDMNFLEYDGGGIYYPSNVSFECSDNNSSFTPLGYSTPQQEINNTKKYKLNLENGVNTRYIKVNIQSPTPNSWSFTDELEIWGHPIISGSFIQLSYGDIWTQSDWEEEFDYMKDLGMDHVVLQWIVDFTPTTKAVYYNSPSYNPTTGFANRNGMDTLLNVLTAAQNKGIDVWIGLDSNSEWWKNSTNQTWLSTEAQRSKDVIKEIWDSPVGYKNKTSLKGWYCSWEIDSYTFQNKIDQTKLRSALKTVVDYAHSYTNKPIMTAPYHSSRSGALSSSGWKDMWVYLLNPTSGANFDVVAQQDSFGNINHTYMAAMKEAIDTNQNCEFWSDVETYAPGPMYAEPTITMLNQLNTEVSYVSKMTSFSFLHYHSPKVVGWAEFEDWKRVIYPRLGKVYTGPVMGYENKAAGKSYASSVAANSTYMDENNAELTNKKYAGSVSFEEDHYQGRQNVPTYSFTVDLQKPTSFISTSLNFIKQLDANVDFPLTVTYSISMDGINFTNIGSVNKPTITPNASANHYRLDLANPAVARYVKAVVTTGTSQWTFCDEMEVIGLI